MIFWRDLATYTSVSVKCPCYRAHVGLIQEKGVAVLVLIDESGCCGFKVGKGSTPYFVIAMVIFDNFTEAERTSAAIGNLRDVLRVRPEFKFSKCRDEIRDRFFECVVGFNFVVRALVVDKTRIYSPHLRTKCESFYNYFVKSLLGHDGGTLSSANVKIDGSGDREFKKSFSRYLMRELGEGKVKKIKFAESYSDNLIQLADMFSRHV